VSFSCLYLKLSSSESEVPLSFVSSMGAAAKQAMRFLRNKYVIKSMRFDGDCGYDLTCRCKQIHAVRKRGYSLSKKIIDERVPAEEINAMRSAIEEQECQISQKGSTTLKTLIGQCMLDWSRSPLENN